VNWRSEATTAQPKIAGNRRFHDPPRTLVTRYGFGSSQVTCVAKIVGVLLQELITRYTNDLSWWCDAPQILATRAPHHTPHGCHTERLHVAAVRHIRADHTALVAGPPPIRIVGPYLYSPGNTYSLERRAKLARRPIHVTIRPLSYQFLTYICKRLAFLGHHFRYIRYKLSWRRWPRDAVEYRPILVLVSRDRIQMCWINTISHAARVVKFQAFRDRLCQELVEHPMYLPFRSPPVRQRITSVSYAPHPEPTTCRLANLDPPVEPDRYILQAKSHNDSVASGILVPLHATTQPHGGTT
jgi:hypothetical protein